MAKAPVETVQKALFTALAALKPYLGDIVVVGGWVPKIYAWAEELDTPPLHSFDVDAAVGGVVPVRSGGSLAELLEGAGFKRRETDAVFALGDFRPRKSSNTQFIYEKGPLQVIFEFIAPLIGRGEKDHKMVQGSVVAPALRFVDILLVHTQEVSIQGETLEGKRVSLKFKVPTLPAFVFAKGLVFPRCAAIDKKGKDLAYILEVLSKPKWRERVVGEIAAVAKKHPATWYRAFRRNLQEHFETEGSAGPAWVALQYPNRKPQELRREALDLFQRFLIDIPPTL